VGESDQWQLQPSEADHGQGLHESYGPLLRVWPVLDGRRFAERPQEGQLLAFSERRRQGWQYGVWNHVVGTYDGSTMRLYINGQQVGSMAATGPISHWTTPLDFGVYANLPISSTYAFAGGIDEYAVYSSALSASAFANHYSAATAGTCLDIGGATSATYTPSKLDVGDSSASIPIDPPTRFAGSG
jgi:hypothetical protein